MGCGWSVKNQRVPSSALGITEGVHQQFRDIQSESPENDVLPLQALPAAEDLCCPPSPNVEDPHMSEIFEFGDFCVGVEHRKEGPPRLTGSTSMGGHRKHRHNWRKVDTFVFGDFQVGLETQLEDEIVENFHQAQGKPLSTLDPLAVLPAQPTLPRFCLYSQRLAPTAHSTKWKVVGSGHRWPLSRLIKGRPSVAPSVGQIE